jgi:predicted AlkP superfamily phosphohydrolase/phosphomutase
VQQGPRVAVIGLDCGTPKLLFDDLNDEVPTIAKLMGEGMYGDLASITPPITVPAWACSMTGRTPGQLGLYGFRNRKDATYDGLSIAHSGSIKVPAVWDKLGEQGKRSVLIGVPPSFPPPSEFPGWRVGCFLTPPSAEKWAYPHELEVEIEEELGGKGQYIFDIPNFRKAGFDVTLDQVFKMTERRFQVGRRLIKNKPWDFFMLCDIAPDRLHHVFWQYVDPRHPLYEPGNKYEGVFRDYYRFLDGELASLVELIPDDAVTMIMSDHGARPMMGGLCFNDWLMNEGYLSMSETLSGPMPIKDAPSVPEREGSRAQGHRGAGSVRGRARRVGRQARGRARPRRAAPGNQGLQAAGRVHRGERRGARPDRVLRRSGVALGGIGGQPEPVHL